MRREVTNFELWLIIFLLGAFAALFSGCTMPRSQFYCGQAADLGTTYYALEMTDGRTFVEENPLAEDTTDVLWLKVGYIALVEVFAHIWPERAETFYWIGAIGGYAPAVHNIVEINR